MPKVEISNEVPAKGCIKIGDGTKRINLCIGANGTMLTADDTKPAGADWKTPSNPQWNNIQGKPSVFPPENHTHNYEPANANIQAHIASSHAPANAQANADITKAEIEAKLTGSISTHSHTIPRTADGAYALLANDTLAQNYAVNRTTKLTVTGNRTLTTTVPSAGSEAFTIILTSGVSSFTITFGSGFKPVGTLATGTTTGRVFVIHWISDGTNLYEAGRTTAMVA